MYTMKGREVKLDLMCSGTVLLGDTWHKGEDSYDDYNIQIC
jgi:hypothetical protein